MELKLDRKLISSKRIPASIVNVLWLYMGGSLVNISELSVPAGCQYTLEFIHRNDTHGYICKERFALLYLSTNETARIRLTNFESNCSGFLFSLKLSVFSVSFSLKLSCYTLPEPFRTTTTHTSTVTTLPSITSSKYDTIVDTATSTIYIASTKPSNTTSQRILPGNPLSLPLTLGVSFGGLVFIMVFLIILVWWKRRRNVETMGNHEEHTDAHLTSENTIITENDLYISADIVMHSNNTGALNQQHGHINTPQESSKQTPTIIENGVHVSDGALSGDMGGNYTRTIRTINNDMYVSTGDVALTTDSGNNYIHFSGEGSIGSENTKGNTPNELEPEYAVIKKKPKHGQIE